MRREEISAFVAALKLSGMSNGPMAAVGEFVPLGIGQDFVGTDEDFCRKVLSHVRAARVICNKGSEELRGVLEQAGRDLLGEMLDQMSDAAECLSDLISLMALAHERL